MAAYAQAPSGARADRPQLQRPRLHEQWRHRPAGDAAGPGARAGQQLLAFGLTDHYRQILALTRLDEAIAHLRQRAGRARGRGADRLTPTTHLRHPRPARAEPLPTRRPRADRSARDHGSLGATGRPPDDRRRDGRRSDTVTGRRVAGPVQGFGQMWQKTFRVRLAATSHPPPTSSPTGRQRSPRSGRRAQRSTPRSRASRQARSPCSRSSRSRAPR